MGILYRPERLQDIQHSYGVGSDQCNAQVVTFAFDPVKACGESGDEQYPRRQIFDHLHNLLRFTALVSFDQILRADRAVWMLLTDLLISIPRSPPDILLEDASKISSKQRMGQNRVL